MVLFSIRNCRGGGYGNGRAFVGCEKAEERRISSAVAPDSGVSSWRWILLTRLFLTAACRCVVVDEYGISEPVPGLGVGDQVRHSPRRVGRAIFHLFVLVAVDKASVHWGIPLITRTFVLESLVVVGAAFEDLAAFLDIRL